MRARELPLTREEQSELADIHPDARDAFYRTVRRRWYINAAAGTLAGWSIEYAAGLNFGWWYTIPMLLMAFWVHRQKWTRTTDYGALAHAKLAENPHDASDWRRTATDESDSTDLAPSPCDSSGVNRRTTRRRR